MTSNAIPRKQLFTASCLALLVTSLSFGIRAGILGKLGTDFHLNASELGTIAATAFWGFPLAIVIGGFIVDIIGMKRLLEMAFIFHLAGIILTITATGYWTLFFSTLLIGIANGTVEAACNPLVASLFTDKKTTKLTHFHLWFPGGIVIGTLIVFGMNHLAARGILFSTANVWQYEVATMLIPTLIYGYLFFKLKFPVSERVAAGGRANGACRLPQHDDAPDGRGTFQIEIPALTSERQPRRQVSVGASQTHGDGIDVRPNRFSGKVNQ